MLFNSFQFLVFFIIVYLVYLLLNRPWQNRWLIVASCFFYAMWNWKFLFLMAASISTDFWCSRHIDRTDDPQKRKIFLLISLFVNLGFLGFFKYYNFFIENFQDLLKYFHIVDPSLNLTLKIILPLGISFYTFEAMSYVVDVYNKKIKPAQNYFDYLLFVIYFPHLIAGPIMRGKDFLPQIVSPRQINAAKFYNGAYLVFLGLFQKVFVADNMAKIVDPIFSNSTGLNGADALIGMYAFTFQIFGDFAGYSNMARGLGLMMGFEISVNFNTPFFATSIQDFWNRWHITLSHWIRDYIYLPLMGALRGIKGNDRIYVALMVSMTLIGLWHGAAWNFVLFGVYYGVLLSLYLIMRIRWANLVLPKSPWGIHFWFWLRVLFTFHLVVMGMLIFRCRSLHQIGSMVKYLFLNFHPSMINNDNLMALIAFGAPLMLLQIGEFLKNDIFFVLKQHWFIRNCALVLMTYLIMVAGVNKPHSFIYFQF